MNVGCCDFKQTICNSSSYFELIARTPWPDIPWKYWRLCLHHSEVIVGASPISLSLSPSNTRRHCSWNMRPRYSSIESFSLSYSCFSLVSWLCSRYVTSSRFFILIASQAWLGLTLSALPLLVSFVMSPVRAQGESFHKFNVLCKL